MAETHFPLTRRFQAGIIGLMCQKFDFLVTAVDLVRPEYFEDPVLIWYFQTARDYFLDYQTKPTFDVLRNELLKASKNNRFREEEIKKYVDTYKTVCSPVDEEQYLTTQVVQFCRRQEMRRTLLEVAPQLSSDDVEVWGQIESKVRDACNVGAHALDIGRQYFVDYQERIEQRLLGDDKNVIPTGIKELDLVLGGGLKSGQLGVWMAGTGIGKSIALPQCGKRAVVGGYKAVNYTLELDDDDYCTRYDANWADVRINRLIEEHELVKKRLDKQATQYGNSLIVKFYPTRTASVSTLRSHLTQLKAVSFVPDIIMVDYGDLLKPLTSYNDEYSDLGGIFADLRGLAGETKTAMWTATQANRGGWSKEVLDLDSVADSFKKVQIADVVIAICMNREERENGEARLFVAKNRNGPAGMEIPIRTAYEKMRFFDPNKSVVKDKKTGKEKKKAPSLPSEEPESVERSPLPVARVVPKRRRRPKAKKYKEVDFPLGASNERDE